MEAAAEGRIRSMALPSPESSFVAVTPCRVVDTRNPVGPFGGPSFSAGQTRTFTIPAGPCAGIPVASAYSLNFTIVNYDASNGFLTVYPSGSARPNVSTVNFGNGTNAVANAAIVPANDAGAIDVFSAGATNVIIDINGYFPVAITRDHVLLCGSSVRDITPYIPGYPVVELRTGCVPSSTTLAMLVTRSGVVSTANLTSYLDGGGIVIGEFNNNDELFNQAFGTAVVQGAFITGGACGDHISPEVQKGTTDGLWESVAYAAPPAGGCGHDMQLFPGITILGGWTAVPASVSLAYRDRGAGRLWLLEADWQDSQTNSGFTPNEIEMFKYMMTHK